MSLSDAVETALLTRFGLVWGAAQQVPWLHRRLNGTLIDRAILKIPPRPNPLSTMSDYTSWASLTDRTWDSRHLPRTPPRALPDDHAVVSLFERGEDMIPSDKSTLLFPYFAEWFVDGFLRSERPHPDPVTDELVRDPARNESSHEIDLMQIYGLTPAVTNELRTFEGGRLKSQELNGEEYPPYLYRGEEKLFETVTVVRAEKLGAEQRRQLFAFGSDTGNLQLGFVLMGVLFLREHNRIAGLLEREYGWDDERLFQTTRNVLTVILMRIVVEEYINHISPYHLRFLADPRSFGNPKWYRQNWMAVEFNLLYRWHSLVPTTLRVADEDLSVAETLFNTDSVVEHGLGRLFDDASRQRAGRIGLYNSGPAVWDAELASIRQAREVGLAPYNDYRELARFGRARRFEDISSDRRVQDGLREVYDGDVDAVEFFPGLFAEDVRPNAALPPLIGRMVAIDAFSQAFTNPLLSPRIFNPETFSPLGWQLIGETNRLSQLLRRNVPDRGEEHLVTMTQPGWRRR